MQNIYCPRCGSENGPSESRCRACGAPLAGESPPRERALERPEGVDEQRIKPPVIRWYAVYCSLMAALYVACAIAGGFLMSANLGPYLHGRDIMEVRIQGTIMLALGILLFFPFVAAPFLPRKRWNWTFGIVLICLGMTSCCCLPACIPLLIYWIKPETKAYYQ